MISIHASVLSKQECIKLLKDINPSAGPEMNYFDGIQRDYNIRKTPCLEHETVQYVLKTHFPNQKCDMAHILYYGDGSYNPAHCDNCIVKDGVVERFKDWESTAIIFLNDNYDGGELIYMYQGLVLHPIVGNMIVAPAGEFYPHEVTKVHGERYTLVLRF